MSKWYRMLEDNKHLMKKKKRAGKREVRSLKRGDPLH